MLSIIDIIEWLRRGDVIFAAVLSFNTTFSTKFELQQKINMPGS